MHNNNAESAHSSIKKMIRRQGRLPKNVISASRVLSVYTLWFKKTTWQERLQALLKAFKVVRNLPQVVDVLFDSFDSTCEGISDEEDVSEVAYPEDRDMNETPCEAESVEIDINMPTD